MGAIRFLWLIGILYVVGYLGYVWIKEKGKGR